MYIFVMSKIRMLDRRLRNRVAWEYIHGKDKLGKTKGKNVVNMTSILSIAVVACAASKRHHKSSRHPGSKSYRPIVLVANMHRS